MRKALWLTAAVLAVVFFFLLITLPPTPQTAIWTGDDRVARRTVAGAYHVHSRASDGAGDRAAIAAAAARAGLRFVILTDHGDGTRSPAAPAYIAGVLCIDGVEISTTGGHYGALDMPATPFPLGGEPSAVVEDVRRFGGFGFAAHPDSAKPQLAWSDWTLPFDGVEWLNGDSEWRDESRATLARVFIDYFVRPGPALASILDRPTASLARWDGLTAQRPVVAIAGHDAHGGIGRTSEDGRRMAIGGVPSYEASFRAFAIRAVVKEPLTGAAAEDARQVLDAIRLGRVFSVVDGIAGPGFLDFRVQDAAGVEHEMGETVPPGRAVITAVASLPEGGQLVLFHNGAETARSGTISYRAERDTSGAYRIEVQVPGAPGTPPIPWLVSNPIYFLAPAPQQPPEAAAGEGVAVSGDSGWHVEKDGSSDGSFSVGSGIVRLAYRLGGGERASQFVALVADLAAPQAFAGIAFEGRSSKPMRVSVQLRYPGSGGRRWARSAFLDSSSRQVVVPVAQLVPADHQPSRPPETSGAGSLLFVVDLTNAVPGEGGTFEIANLRFTH